jgi:hypothetical protein
LDLVASLFLVLLINTYGIYPQYSVLIFNAEVFQRDVQIIGDSKTIVVELDGVWRLEIPPCV